MEIIQQHAGRRAIDLLHQAAHRQEDKRDQHGQDSIGHGYALDARNAVRVAGQVRGGKNRGNRHSVVINPWTTK